MEGECRVQSIQLLSISYFKFIILGFLLSISVIGLLLLKYFKKLRAAAFYNKLTDNDSRACTHVFVAGQEETQEISEVERLEHDGTIRLVFKFKELRYELQDGSWIPLGLPYSQQIDLYTSEEYVSKGMTSREAILR